MDDRPGLPPRITAAVPRVSGQVPPPAAVPQAGTGAQECCDRCGSVQLIRVKACWRCGACGYKSDCNGW